MISNPEVQHRYELHTKYLSRDIMHLGDAEGLEDVIEVIEKIHPNVYMLARCCSDGAPTLQLANWETVRRMRIGGFSESELQEMNELLAERGIGYKKTKYYALKPDFSETFSCKIQRILKPLYAIDFWFSQKLRLS